MNESIKELFNNNEKDYQKAVEMARSVGPDCILYALLDTREQGSADMFSAGTWTNFIGIYLTKEEANKALDAESSEWPGGFEPAQWGSYFRPLTPDIQHNWHIAEVPTNKLL